MADISVFTFHTTALTFSLSFLDSAAASCDEDLSFWRLASTVDTLCDTNSRRLPSNSFLDKRLAWKVVVT